ncbi:MAG: hypothetical protein JW807_04725 [Spirochaetes bacterium]|nr:hypothetical protein [Spirochaetota bacterium]
MYKYITAACIVCLALIAPLSCSAGKAVRYLDRPIPANSSLAIIIDAPNKVKNVVMTRFLARGFTVKAINASDFFSLNDVFDYRDFKKVSYIGQDENFLSLEKTYNSLFKMHFYNYEVNKAEVLSDMRNKWNVQYLILLDLKSMGGAWGRAIDLRTNDLVWIENQGVSFGGDSEKITDGFIDSMTGKK